MILSKKVAIDVLNESLKSGAEYAEIFAQDEKSHHTIISHKKVDSIVSNIIYGAGIRLIKGKQVVYGYTSDLSKSSLLKLASSLSQSFNEERIIEIKELKTVKNKNIHKVIKPHNSMKLEEKINYLKKAEKAIYEVSDSIVNANCNLLEWDQKIEIYNSKGNAISDNRVRTRLVFSAVAMKNGSYERGFKGPGGSLGLELLDEVDPIESGTEVGKIAYDLLTAPECPSGKMTVIIGNAFGGVIFHEACGHPLEACSIVHNTSTFCGKLGKQVASSIVSAVDDGTIKNGWGSSNFDDEGNLPTKNVLIKDGILVNYMIDDYNSKFLNLHSTGACRRQSYKFIPTTRMTNTYICNGTSSVEEMIKNTKYGLYCVSFSGGSVDPATDKFNFTASSAYVIKDGKIDHLVKDASLIGYGYEVLMNIDMVGNDLKRGQGNCGSSSGYISVDVGQPTIRVKNMTVGGRGGEV